MKQDEDEGDDGIMDNSARLTGGDGWPNPIRLARGVLEETGAYLKSGGFARALVVADAATADVAGRRLERLLAESGLPAGLLIVLPNASGDVVADEASILQVLVELDGVRPDVLIAAGSGTIHDIVRYAGHTARVPFVSVPTAPSVDGFTSKGAPILLRGNKITLPAIAPLAIFADLDILTEAPQPLVAAGFGDMLGKYTSLFDWAYGRETAGEPYDEEAAAMTERALADCVTYAEEIGRRTETGIRVLMGALIESGLAMLKFGQSHPASGAEHHISHYWEMELLRTGRRQVLHGAKVGAACALIADLYKRAAASGGVTLSEAMQARLTAVPDGARLRELLGIAGGPQTAEALGIEPELLERSVREAHRVRLNRRTLLRTINEGS